MNDSPSRKVLSHRASMLIASGVLLVAASGCGSEDDKPTNTDAVNAGGGSAATNPQGSGGTGSMQIPATPPGPAGAQTSTGDTGAGATGSTGAGATGDTASGDTGGDTGSGDTPPAPIDTDMPTTPDLPSDTGMGGANGMGMDMGMGGSTDTDGEGSAGADGEDGAGGEPQSMEGPTGSTDGPTPSTGCGQTPPSSDRYTIDVGGMSREYILAVPENYDPDTAYRLVFTWHPWGGSAQQVAGNGPSGYYGLLGASGGEAIFVSPEGLDFGGNGRGWGNENGQDIDFLRAMIERFDAELCFDHSRMFSTGFSFGGMMSNAVACAGLARAVAPMAGNSMVSGCENGTQPVAYMGFHGDADTVVAISGGEAARDVFIERNGCGGAMPSDSNYCDTAGADPCTCTSYEGCQEGYPVTWCQFTGGHTPAPNSAETIWNFFAQF